MPTFILRLLFVFFLPISLSAQKALPKPLTFVNGQAVIVMRQGSDNLVMRAMQISPFLSPQTPTLTPREVKHYRRLLKRPFLQSRQPEDLAKLLLVSGNARFAEALDSIKQTYFPQLETDSLQTAAAQNLLNSLSWIAATDDKGVYINLHEDCMINVHTEHFRFTIDQICTPNRRKYRISGLATSKTPLTIRLRIPTLQRLPKFYLNGRAILAPKIIDGYLVVERPWRNNEEIYYDLEE